ncbi:fibrillin-2-like [Sycon ciliatum]|uniref:fibrillin-2-like n=1 Tax=Sycon ciliatum TaxID=27933 RepID=UPI0031F71A0B
MEYCGELLLLLLLTMSFIVSVMMIKECQVDANVVPTNSIMCADGHTYVHYDEEQCDFEGAEAFCKYRNATLPLPLDQTIDSCIRGLDSRNNRRFWLGFMRISSSQDWSAVLPNIVGVSDDLRGSNDKLCVRIHTRDVEWKEEECNKENNVNAVVCVTSVSFPTDCPSGSSCSTTESLCDTGPCSVNATCSDVAGSFVCMCFSGYTGNGTYCQDIDECTLGLLSCGVRESCYNTLGAAYCACAPGYGDNGTACSDIDECADDISYSNGISITGSGSSTDNSNISSNCGENTVCVNTVPGFLCQCLAGYEAVTLTACQDIDECTTSFNSSSSSSNATGVNNCSVNAICTNTVGCYECTCLNGYHGDGVTCLDENECTDGPHHCALLTATCYNTNGSYTCECIDGYMGNGTVCDICPAGFYGNGTACLDIDECVSNSNSSSSNISNTTTSDSNNSSSCGENTVCVNTVPGFLCQCLAGYEAVTHTICQDIDECSTSFNSSSSNATGVNNCSVNAICTNTVGCYECTCLNGYHGDGVTCLDENECTDGLHQCAPLTAACSNTNGSYTCECIDGFVGNGTVCDVCPAGFYGNGTACLDINECVGNNTTNTSSNNNSSICGENTVCVNTVPGFLCQCLAGYEAVTHTICQDIDECSTSFNSSSSNATGVNNCSVNAICTNTAGCYECTCLNGYHGDGVTCLDENECTDGPHQCAPLTATCSNTNGSYICECIDGFMGNGTVCDICPAGFYGNGTACLDIDECVSNSNSSSSNISNTTTSDNSNSSSCSANAVCVNTVPGFLCQCLAGYEAVTHTICQDIDECSTSFNSSSSNATGVNNCSVNAICTNTAGCYECTCLNGYRGNGVTCLDENECSDGPHQCALLTATCYNTNGSYTCECIHGFVGNGTVCDVCPAGFYGNGTVCLDINECISNNTTNTSSSNNNGSSNNNSSICGENTVCVNTVPGFLCQCLAGYEAVTHTICQDIDECTTDFNSSSSNATGVNNCSVNAICTNTAGCYECTCLNGYHGDGVTCLDENECTDGPHQCAPLTATCSNTNGSYICECIDGFMGNGTVCDICPAGFYGNGTACLDIDECASNSNIGTTTSAYSSSDTTTNNNSSSSSCGENTVCVNTVPGFLCQCLAGYEAVTHTACQDIDECSTNFNSSSSNATGVNNCSVNAICTNTAGCYECTCLNGYHGDGVTCLDENECTDGLHQCALLTATCYNTNGSYTCECIDGFMGNGTVCDVCPAGFYGNGTTCLDIDECVKNTNNTSNGSSSNNNSSSDSCGENTVCVNTVPGFLCQCLAGYEAVTHTACQDIDECTTSFNSSSSNATGVNNCSVNAICTNTAGCYECTCLNGYHGDGVTCLDENECSDGPHQCALLTATCYNTNGSYTCECIDGFMGNGTVCDVCPAGFYGNGTTCLDIDECVKNTNNTSNGSSSNNNSNSDICGENTVCVNTVPGFLCQCLAGYEAVTHTICQDIDECTTSFNSSSSSNATGVNNCSANAICTNTAGCYECTCLNGYRGNGVTCLDENECTDGPHQCALLTATCTNTNGSYTCECVDGYMGNGTVCEVCPAGFYGNGTACLDIDECVSNSNTSTTGNTTGSANNNSSSCGENTVCVNTVPGFLCQCLAGYEAVTHTACQDIDECTTSFNSSSSSNATGVNNCSVNAICTNTAGCYECTCLNGYHGDGVTCLDENECTDGPHQCALLTATCSNTNGSYTCECIDGFMGNGTVCEVCPAGFYGNGTACLDIDECVSNSSNSDNSMSSSSDSCSENTVCVNTVPGFLCQCLAGYEAVTHTACQDIDECTTSFNSSSRSNATGVNNCSVNAICTNTAGCYECTCLNGFRGDGVTCLDENECTDGPHQCALLTATCSNTNGSYTCECIDGFMGNGTECDVCPAGFYGNGTACLDIDECVSNSSSNTTNNCTSASSSCVNTDGGFECACFAGYTGQLCDVDIDECLSGPCFNGSCRDLVAKYECDCYSGYTGSRCASDVNECEQQLDNCTNGTSSCVNVDGGFECACFAGYTGVVCDIDVNECLSEPCRWNGSCSDHVGSYMCHCLPGFTGLQCQHDIDECSVPTHNNCSANTSSCVNTDGGFQCSCSAGYTGPICDIEVDECSSSPCIHGTCMDQIAGYLCDCISGFNGLHCEHDIHECLLGTHNCTNNASECVNFDGGFDCMCFAGYTGSVCEVNIDECLSMPCFNGSCMDLVAGYACNCSSGYTGSRCQSDLDECLTGVHNCSGLGGNCSNTFGGFECACFPGYAGPMCDIETDECASEPCINGTCRDQGAGYVCDCTAGFTSQHCDIEMDECSSEPCLNNGTCSDQVAGYVCDCTAGFTSPHCVIEIDECSSEPCFNNGSCRDQIAGYACNCTAGFTSQHCDIEIDECASEPCFNGSCRDQIAGYACECFSGYTGLLCENDLHECLLGTHNCTNHTSVCINLDGGFECMCFPGYTGPICDVDIDECTSSPCVYGTCIDQTAGFTCSCLTGFSGVRCQSDNDECQTGAHNCSGLGGNCDNTHGGFQCTCFAGYTGPECSVTIDECLSAPCQNNGTCVDQIAGFECQCNTGFTSALCDVDINECASEPCQNNATCVDEINSFQCQCHPGYNGTLCSNDINDCSGNPCLNQATCTDGVNSYACTCAPGFSGLFCEQNVDDCLGVMCGNNGSCVNLVNGFECTCVAGYTGVFCEVNVEECSSAPCQNNATCVDLVNAYRCECEPGFTGLQCEDDIDHCTSAPCVNNATCTDLVNAYRCDCIPGFTGLQCQTDIVECLSSPCDNGTCVDGINGYVCVCNGGFTGFTCEINVEECESDPCVQGTCVDQVNSYQCVCSAGYTGVLCEVNINECLSMPCVNGTCNDNVDGFTCSCTPGFTGLTCAVDINECVSTPCVNGSCNDAVNAFSCDCFPGFSGMLCNTDILECASEPCQNNQSCVELTDGFACTCSLDYFGVLCENVNNSCTDPALTVPRCLNSGVCVPEGIPQDSGGGGGSSVSVNSYNCQCLPGFTGVHCEVNVDDCLGMPCLNNAVCMDMVDAYQCQCQSGFTGQNCQVDIDDCIDVNCTANSKCRDGVDQFQCVCDEGYVSTTSDSVNTEIHCTDEDECRQADVSVCPPNSNCLNTIGSFDCTCQSGFSGDRHNGCVDINECVTGANDCDVPTRARCVNTAGGVRCECFNGTTGNGTTCYLPAAVDPLPATLRNVFASTEVRITCNYRGYPQATPRWCKLSNDDITMTSSLAADGCAAYDSSCPYAVTGDSSSTTTLVIGQVQNCHRGLYRCIATNIANLQGSYSDVELDVLDSSDFKISGNYSEVSSSSVGADVQRTLEQLLQAIPSVSVELPSVKVTQFSPNGVALQNLVFVEMDVRMPSSSVSALPANGSFANRLRLYLVTEIQAGRSSPATLDATSVSVLSYDVCPADVTTDLRGSVVWPETVRGTTSVQACGIVVENEAPQFARRMCFSSPRTSLPNTGFFMSTWAMANTSDCPFASASTRELQMISSIVFNTSEPTVLVMTTETIGNLTKDASSLSEADIDFAATALSNLILATSSDEDFNQTIGREIAGSVLDSVDNILAAPPTEIESAPAATIARTMERLVTSLEVEEGQPLTSVNENIGFAISCSGRVISQAFRAAAGTGDDAFSVGDVTTSAAVSSDPAAFDVPSNAIEFATTSRDTMAQSDANSTSSSVPSCPVAQTQFILYRTDSLFQDINLTGTSAGARTTVASQIVSAQVGRQEERIPLDGASAVMSFNLNLPDISTQNETLQLECVFWDFTLNDNQGGWSREGCRLISNGSSRAACECNHLTNFAVLVSRKAIKSSHAETVAEKVLVIISYIGCGLSMLGLVATMITIATFKKLRASLHQRLMFGLCTTLLTIMILFIAGIRATSNRAACQSVAIIMHYLLLSAFLWMSAEATLLYTQLVKVFGGTPAWFAKAVLATVCGAPLVIVGITAGVTKLDAYTNENYCWISDFNVFYGAFIAPMALTLLYNIAILTIIIRSLHKRGKNNASMKRKGKKDNKGALYLVRVVVTLSLLLGLTWVFGILVVLVDHIAMQYAFAILNTFQGFLIFILHTARAPEVRKEWSGALASAGRRGSIGYRLISTLRRHTITSMGSGDMMPSNGASTHGGRGASGGRKSGSMPARNSSLGQSCHVMINGHSLLTATNSNSLTGSPRASPPPPEYQLQPAATEPSSLSLEKEPAEKETSLSSPSDNLPSLTNYSMLSNTNDVSVDEESGDMPGRRQSVDILIVRV